MRASQRRPAARAARESAVEPDHIEIHAKMAGRLASAAALERDPKLRQQMIAREAYYRAEKRGFVAGSELEDWLEAEKEVDDLLKSSERGSGEGTPS